MDWVDRERNFWIVGGDLRQRALARLLREDGHTVHIAALEGEGLVAEPLGPGLALAHCVILPLPVTRRGEILHTPLSREEVTLPQLLDWLEPGQVLCGGMVDPQAAAAAQARGCWTTMPGRSAWWPMRCPQRKRWDRNHTGKGWRHPVEDPSFPGEGTVSTNAAADEKQRRSL